MKIYDETAGAEVKLRIIFPEFECRLSEGHLAELSTLINGWLFNGLDEYRYFWVLASADRVYLRVTDESLNENLPPDFNQPLMEIGYLHPSAFEKGVIVSSDIISGIWSMTEADAQKFLTALVENTKRGCAEMFLKLHDGGVWKCGAMSPFSQS